MEVSTHHRAMSASQAYTALGRPGVRPSSECGSQRALCIKPNEAPVHNQPAHARTPALAPSLPPPLIVPPKPLQAPSRASYRQHDRRQARLNATARRKAQKRVTDLRAAVYFKRAQLHTQRRQYVQQREHFTSTVVGLIHALNGPNINAKDTGPLAERRRKKKQTRFMQP